MKSNLSYRESKWKAYFKGGLWLCDMTQQHIYAVARSDSRHMLKRHFIDIYDPAGNWRGTFTNGKYQRREP